MRPRITASLTLNSAVGFKRSAFAGAGARDGSPRRVHTTNASSTQPRTLRTILSAIPFGRHVRRFFAGDNSHEIFRLKPGSVAVPLSPTNSIGVNHETHESHEPNRSVGRHSLAPV